MTNSFFQHLNKDLLSVSIKASHQRSLSSMPSPEVYDCFARPWPYAERLVDSALSLQREDWGVAAAAAAAAVFADR